MIIAIRAGWLQSCKWIVPGDREETFSGETKGDRLCLERHRRLVAHGDTFPAATTGMRARGHDSWQESLAGDSIALDEDDFKDLLQHVTDRNQDWTRERKLPGRSVRHKSGKQTRNLAFSKYLQISPSLPCTKARETTAVTGMKEIVLARCPAYFSIFLGAGMEVA